MKKLFLLSAMLLGLFVCNEAKAESKIFYAKVTVDVAEESKGLGTVYLVTNGGEEVTELTGQGSQVGSEGATVGFKIKNTPADGYVLMNFTDQAGNVVDFTPYTESDRTQGDVGVWATSTDEENPSAFNLYAHFVLESELPQGELVEVTVPADMKYATYFSPVDTETPYDVKVYTFDSVKDDAVVLTEDESGVIPAFTAVLVENTGMFDTVITATYEPDQVEYPMSFSTGLLTGTLEEIKVPAGSYVLVPVSAGGAEFSIAEDEDTVPVSAYQCYLTAENTTAAKISIGESSPSTVINALLNDSENVEIYNLDGNRLENLQKGVNIVNGVKVIVK